MIEVPIEPQLERNIHCSPIELSKNASEKR